MAFGGLNLMLSFYQPSLLQKKLPLPSPVPTALSAGLVSSDLATASAKTKKKKTKLWMHQTHEHPKD